MAPNVEKICQKKGKINSDPTVNNSTLLKKKLIFLEMLLKHREKWFKNNLASVKGKHTTLKINS